MGEFSSCAEGGQVALARDLHVVTFEQQTDEGTFQRESDQSNVLTLRLL